MQSGILPVMLSLALSMTPSALLAASRKKGVGEYLQPHGTETISQLHVSWYYDWAPVPDIREAPARVQFIPMIWGLKNLNMADLEAAKATGAGILLGFNEPNGKNQANMTVQQALDAWPQLEALHMRLGSPAPGGDAAKPGGWLAKFMAGAKIRGYRVDFICIHPYQASSDPDQATKDLVAEVVKVHNMYNLPIWVTEYAMARWDPLQHTPEEAIQAKFAEESANALEALPFVERYAWYGDVPNQPTFSLYHSDGTATSVGAAWIAAPTDAGATH